jgi:hypothetical protein
VKFVSRLLSRSVRPFNTQPRAARVANAVRRSVEPLEDRTLFAVALQPLANLTLAQGSPAQAIDLTEVFFDNATGQNDLTFSAKSDNTALAQTSVDSSGVLSIALAPAASGFARLSISAKAPDNSVALDTIRLQVTASADRSLDVPLGPGHTQFRYVMANHTTATISLTGPGTGTIHLGGDNLAQVGDHARGANQEIESITLTGTTAATQLTINGVSAKRGTVFADVGHITSDGSLGSLRVRRLFLDGDVNLAGGIKTLNVDGARSSTMSFGQSIGAINLSMGTIIDENLSTPAPFSQVRGGNWFSSDSVPETFKAAYLGRVLTTGHFDVGVQLTGDGAPARMIGSLSVRGEVGGTWNIPGASAPLLIGGSTFDWNATFGSLASINDFGTLAGSLTVPSISSIRVHGTMQNELLNLTGAGGTDLGNLQVFGIIKDSTINAAGNLGRIRAEALQGSLVYAGVGTLPFGETLPNLASDLSMAATIQSITLVPRAKVVGFLGSDIAASSVGNLSLATTQIANNGIPFGIAATSIGRVTMRDLTTHHFIAINNVHDAATLATQIAALGFSLQDLTIRQLS